jgi:hypothetical protein
MAGYMDWNIKFAFWVETSITSYAGVFRGLEYAKELIQSV